MTMMKDYDVLDILQQRYPFLLIDKILELEPQKRIVAIKNISLNEPHFQGNLPNYPVMPGSLVMESMAQSATALLLSHSDLSGRLLSFKKVRDLVFKKQAFPGDQLRIEVAVKRLNELEASFLAKAFVDGSLIAEGNLVFEISQIPSKPKIHPTASVHPSAILGKDVVIGPYSIVGEDVIVGDRTRLEAHVYLEKWTKIGDDSHIHFGSVIGAPPQDTKYKGEKSWVVIGDNSILREYVTVHRATGKNEVTKIGSDTMIMINAHIGHNSIVEDRVTMANMVTLGGHVEIGEGAVIGGMTGIHQFVRVGRGTMTGGYSRLIQDVPPFMLCDGNPAHVRGLNAIGLKRGGVRGEAFKGLKDAYKALYRSQLNVKQALKEMAALPDSESLSVLTSFLKKGSGRGISKKTELSDSET